MEKEIPKKYWLAMIFLTLFVSFSFQGSRGLWETTEGRYAECAREMVESGNYLEPTVGYRSLWTKPPLTYWAIAAGIKLLGSNEWGVRFYNAFALFLTVLAVAYLGVTLWGKRTGIVAGFIYASSAFPIFGAYAVTTDSLLTLWEVVSILCYLKASHAASARKSNGWIVAMWISFGFGFLTKGPAALIPLIPIVLWHFWRKMKVKLGNPLGLSLFILIGFSWYAVESMRYPELASYFLGRQVLERIASSSFHNPQWYKPFTIYLPVLILGSLPWLWFGAKVLQEEGLVNPVRLWRHFKNGGDSSFLGLWFFLPLILFFLTRSRLFLYVLPLYAPLALVMARGICNGRRGKRIVKRIATVAFCAGFVFAGAKGVIAFRHDKRDMKPLYEACRKLGGDSRDFLLFTRSNTWTLYGLQFYLNGHLKRITPTGKEPWADGTAANVLMRIIDGHSQTPHMIISDKRQSANLLNMAGALDVRFKITKNRYWEILCFEKESVSGKRPPALQLSLLD